MPPLYRSAPSSGQSHGTKHEGGDPVLRNIRDSASKAAAYWMRWVHRTSATPAMVLWRWDKFMASSALKSGSRSIGDVGAATPCLRSHADLAVTCRRSVGSSSATAWPLKHGRTGIAP